MYIYIYIYLCIYIYICIHILLINIIYSACIYIYIYIYVCTPRHNAMYNILYYITIWYNLSYWYTTLWYTIYIYIYREREILSMYGFTKPGELRVGVGILVCLFRVFGVFLLLVSALILCLFISFVFFECCLAPRTPRRWASRGCCGSQGKILQHINNI